MLSMIYLYEIQIRLSKLLLIPIDVTVEHHQDTSFVRLHHAIWWRRDDISSALNKYVLSVCLQEILINPQMIHPATP